MKIIMGIQQSFMSCNDEAKQCMYKQTPYLEYDKFVNTIKKDDPEKEKKIKFNQEFTNFCFFFNSTHGCPYLKINTI